MDKALVFLGALLLYLVWGALVVFQKADPTGYVAAIAAGLTFIGKHISQPQAPPSEVAPALLALPATPGEARSMVVGEQASPVAPVSTPASAAPAAADTPPTLQ